MLVRPDGLSYGVKQTRNLVLRAAGAPSGGRWQVVLFEDADRATEQAANALLKAIEEPAPRTVWLLCAPVRGGTGHHDQVPVPAGHAAHAAAGGGGGGAGRRDGVDPEPRAGRRPGRAGPHRPGPAAGHRPRGGAAAGRGARGAVPGRQPRARRWPRRPRLVKAAEQEAAAVTEELDEPEREALRQAFGEGSTGKGVAKAVRGAAGALKDLEDRQKSRATRLKRDALDRALLDLAAFYRDVLAVQLGADVDLASAGHEAELRRLAAAAAAGVHGAPDRGDHGVPGAAGAERCAAARRRGDDPRPPRRLTPPRPAPPPPAPRAPGRPVHDRGSFCAAGGAGAPR